MLQSQRRLSGIGAAGPISWAARPPCWRPATTLRSQAPLRGAGCPQVLTAEALLADEHPFLEDDHMFSAFVAKGIVDDLVGRRRRRTRSASHAAALTALHLGLRR